jgi:hypothetical protein
MRTSTLSDRSTQDMLISENILEMRIRELCETQRVFISNRKELRERLRSLHTRCSSIASPGDTNRKRDMVKQVIKNGVSSVLGYLPLPKASTDPYVRSSTSAPSAAERHSSLSDSLRDRVMNWFPAVDWDEIVALEITDAVNELLKLHNVLLSQFEKAQRKDHLQAISDAFLSHGELVVGHHLSYHKAAERGLLMIQVRHSGRFRHLHDLLVRPTQRIAHFQLFVDDFQRDAVAAGRHREAAGLEAASACFHDALRRMNEGSGTYDKDCRQTVAAVLRRSPAAAERAAELLRAQRRALMQVEAVQAVRRARLRGGERAELVPRQLMVLEDDTGERCLALFTQVVALCCRGVSVTRRAYPITSSRDLRAAQAQPGLYSMLGCKRSGLYRATGTLSTLTKLPACIADHFPVQGRERRGRERQGQRQRH